jgi:hypothetical protein
VGFAVKDQRITEKRIVIKHCSDHKLALSVGLDAANRRSSST